MGAITVRDATAADVEAIATIYDHHVATSVATFDTQPVGRALLTAKIATVGGSDHVLLAEQDGEVLGYACSGPFRARPAYAQTKEVTVYAAAGAGGGVAWRTGRRRLTTIEAFAVSHTRKWSRVRA